MLVSIVIPTKNSANSLGKCLQAIKEGTFSNVEVIIVDSGSTDETLEIATQFGAKVFTCPGKRTLGQRAVGVREASGQYILLLDSDQFLEKSSVERALQSIGDYDMLVFEELSLEPGTIMEKLAAANKKLVHRVGKTNPYTGEVIPRFFKSETLKKVYQAIPERLHGVWTHEDAIFYFEACRIILQPKVGFVAGAIYHQELKSSTQFIRKSYRYGKLAKAMVKEGYYQELVSKRDRLWKKLRWAVRYPKYGIAAFVFTLMLKIPYRIGFLIG